MRFRPDPLPAPRAGAETSLAKPARRAYDELQVNVASQASRARSGFVSLVAIAFLAAAFPWPSLPAGPSFEPNEVVLSIDALAGGLAWTLSDGARSRLAEDSKRQSKTALLCAPSPAASPRRGPSPDDTRASVAPRNPSNLGAPSRAPPYDR